MRILKSIGLWRLARLGALLLLVVGFAAALTGSPAEAGPKVPKTKTIYDVMLDVQGNADPSSRTISCDGCADSRTFFVKFGALDKKEQVTVEDAAGTEITFTKAEMSVKTDHDGNIVEVLIGFRDVEGTLYQTCFAARRCLVPATSETIDGQITVTVDAEDVPVVRSTPFKGGTDVVGTVSIGDAVYTPSS